MTLTKLYDDHIFKNKNVYDINFLISGQNHAGEEHARDFNEALSLLYLIFLILLICSFCKLSFVSKQYFKTTPVDC